MGLSTRGGDGEMVTHVPLGEWTTCLYVVVQQAGAWQLPQQFPGSCRSLERLPEGVGQLRMRSRRIQRGQQQVAGAG
jgi:hypothetical protein